MKLRELIDKFRQETGDIRKPYKVGDDYAILYANEGEAQACRRARLLVDSTSNVAQVVVNAGDPMVSISDSIISVRRLRLSSRAGILAKATVREMDERFPGWDTATTQSTPCVAVVDYQTGAYRLYPTPKADDTLLQTVTREPIAAMEDDDDTPEIAPRYHDGLVEWMKYRAYSNEDTDLYDASAAAVALAAFEGEFGQARGAINERFEFEHYDDVGEF